MPAIDIGQMLPMVSDVLFTTLTAFSSFAVAKLCQWLKAKRDGELGQILDKALAMGIAFGMSKLNRLGEARVTVEVKSDLVADAANYVLAQVPEAVKALRLDGAHLARMIEARLKL